MADLSTKKSNFISQFRDAGVEMLDARDRLRAKRNEFAALTATMPITDADFVGSNAYLGIADLGAAMVALDALEAVLTDPTTGNPTANLTALMKLRP